MAKQLVSTAIKIDPHFNFELYTCVGQLQATFKSIKFSRMNLLATFGVVAISTGAFLNLMIAIALIIKGWKFFGSMKRLLSNRIIILSLFYVLSSLSFLTFWFMCTALVYMNWFYYGLHISICISFFIFYVTMICRLYFSFKNIPKHALSPCVLCISITFVLLQIATYICLFVIPKVIDTRNANYYGTILIITFESMDIMFNTLTLYWFLTRLYQIITQLEEKDRKHTNTFDDTLTVNINNRHVTDDSESISLSTQLMISSMHDEVEIKFTRYTIATKQIEIVDLMTKLTLLAIIYEVLLCAVVIMWIICMNEICDNACTVLVLLIVIYTCFITFVLYSTFAFNHNDYLKCCGVCHRCLKNCCIKLVNKRNIDVYHNQRCQMELDYTSVEN